MAKRKKYNLKSTNDFLILMILCGALMLWAIFDGWLPTKSVLKKHPRVMVVCAEQSGTIIESIETGSDAQPGIQLFQLTDRKFKTALSEAELAYRKAKTANDSAEQRAQLAAVKAAREALDNCTTVMQKTYTDYTNDGGTLIVKSRNEGAKNEYKVQGGIVARELAPRNRRVEKGDPIVEIYVSDHFYPFNKSLAVLMGIMVAIFGWLHNAARK